jgi:hypothetical protein
MDNLALIALLCFLMPLTIGIAAIYIALRIKYPDSCQQSAAEEQRKE